MSDTVNSVREFAPAKINLFLHVGQKRLDGFHDLESLVVFARVGDVLTFEQAEDLTLTIDGPFSAVLSADDDNLVLKAARALAARGKITPKAKITLTKNLPVASGIGGGSADAAAALRGLNKLWGLPFIPDQLRSVGGAFGSDIPVCIEPQAAWMAGRGEKVQLLDDIATLPMVLVNPGVPVPTGPVFKALQHRHGTGLPLPGPMSTNVLLEYLSRTANDLEAPALDLAPAVRDVLTALRDQAGVLMARMSGSGATCFALCQSHAAAVTAAATIAAQHPDWWAVAG